MLLNDVGKGVIKRTLNLKYLQGFRAGTRFTIG